MENNWYRLDNTSKFFASSTYIKDPYVFRFSCTLIDDINKSSLEKALNEVLNIYPNFKVNLKRGFFWYYLDSNEEYYKVFEEKDPICSKIHFYHQNDQLIRVSFFKKRINLEVTHILSDGLGALSFFKTLIYQYIKYEYRENNIKINIPIKEKDISFNDIKNYPLKRKTNKSKLPKFEKVFKYKRKKRKSPVFYEAHCGVTKLKRLAHKYDTTITIFLVSTLIDTISKKMNYKDKNKKIKISIPIDLRKYFDSTTTKNFFSIISISYKKDNGNENLSTIINKVHKIFIQELDKEKIMIRVNEMIKLEKNFILSSFPLFIKNIVLSLSSSIAEHNTTSCFSNIGKINIDSTAKKYIKNFNVLTSSNSFQFTSCSYDNDFCLGIVSTYKTNSIVREYLKTLSSLGLNFKINTSKE